MSQEYFKLPRLYTGKPLALNTTIKLADDQCHYLKNVMRRQTGDEIRLFNGKEGDVLGRIEHLSKKEALVQLVKQIKPQAKQTFETHLLFTPLAKNRLDQVIEKTVELGVTHLHPIITNRTEHRKLKTERIEKQIIEACEQSERQTIPVLEPLKNLSALLSSWPYDCIIQWCCERDLAERKPLGYNTEKTQAFLVGPVGGFDDEEIDYLSENTQITPISLGQDILRAETASMLCLSAVKLLKC